MQITKKSKVTFHYKSKIYRIVDICWADDDSESMEPTVVYVDENGDNKWINSGKGKVFIE